MDCFIIDGPSKIDGEITVSGSKNSALPILFASLLTDEKCVLNSVPELSDIKTTYDLLTYVGKNCFFGFNRFEVSEINKIITIAPYELVRKMRASILVAGPLLARFKHVQFSMPGGCAIGVRPIDIHLEGFKKFGAEVVLKEGYIILKAKKLKPAIINLRFPSVGATENLLMTASLIDGESVINNAAREPEIEELACVLNKMGAVVNGAGSKTIRIKGAKKLKGFEHKIIGDRIEAGTFLILGALCAKKLVVKNVCINHLETLLRCLKKSGAEFETLTDSLVIYKNKKIKPVDIKTEPYPGFPTDLQAQWMAYMCFSEGKSKIEENIFENRFMHAAELVRMGADIKIEHNVAYVKGVKKLTGATVMVSDLRAGAGLVIAALNAYGQSKIRRVYHIDRGYEKIEEKLSSIGAKIRRVEE